MTKVRYKLESGVLAAASIPAAITSGCDSARRTSGSSFPCWVTYAGSKVTFTITIKNAYGGGVLRVVEYDIKAHEVILTRETILRKAAKARGGDPIRCDEFPEISVVGAGATLAQSCYWKPRHKETRRLKVRATGIWENADGVVSVGDE